MLLHGFPQTSYAWRKIMPALAGHRHDLAPDLRGAAPPTGPITATINARSPRTSASSPGSWGSGPVNLVGHDVGMMVAYAASFPG